MSEVKPFVRRTIDIPGVIAAAEYAAERSLRCSLDAAELRLLACEVARLQAVVKSLGTPSVEAGKIVATGTVADCCDGGGDFHADLEDLDGCRLFGRFRSKRVRVTIEEV